MPEPCPRDCGHPNQERHTCIALPSDDFDTTNWHCQTCGTTVSSGHECSREAILDCLAQHRWQRVEDKARIAALEDAVRGAVAIAEEVPALRKTNTSNEYATRLANWLPRAKELLP